MYIGLNGHMDWIQRYIRTYLFTLQIGGNIWTLLVVLTYDLHVHIHSYISTCVNIVNIQSFKYTYPTLRKHMSTEIARYHSAECYSCSRRW